MLVRVVTEEPLLVKVAAAVLLLVHVRAVPFGVAVHVPRPPAIIEVTSGVITGTGYAFTVIATDDEVTVPQGEFCTIAR